MRPPKLTVNVENIPEVKAAIAALTEEVERLTAILERVAAARRGDADGNHMENLEALPDEIAKDRDDLLQLHGQAWRLELQVEQAQRDLGDSQAYEDQP